MYLKMAEIHQLTLNYIQFQTWLLHLPTPSDIYPRLVLFI